MRPYSLNTLARWFEHHTRVYCTASNTNMHGYAEFRTIDGGMMCFVELAHDQTWFIPIGTIEYSQEGFTVRKDRFWATFTYLPNPSYAVGYATMRRIINSMRMIPGNLDLLLAALAHNYREYRKTIEKQTSAHWYAGATNCLRDFCTGEMDESYNEWG